MKYLVSVHVERLRLPKGGYKIKQGKIPEKEYVHSTLVGRQDTITTEANWFNWKFKMKALKKKVKQHEKNRSNAVGVFRKYLENDQVRSVVLPADAVIACREDLKKVGLTFEFPGDNDYRLEDMANIFEAARKKYMPETEAV